MEPFLGNANEREEWTKATTQAETGKEMFVFEIAVPKFAQFCERNEKKGRKQLTFNLFLQAVPF